MRKFVKDWLLASPSHGGGQRFIVVLMPWLGTAVPWFSLAIGMLLLANAVPVSFVVDDMPFGNKAVRFRFILACIKYVLRLLRSSVPVLRLSEFSSPKPLDHSDANFISRLAGLNAVWELRGEISVNGRKEMIDRFTSQLLSSAVAIAALMRTVNGNSILVPGGVFGSSGVWVNLAKKAGLRVCSFDSGGPEIVMLASQGIACQLQDIPSAFALLRADCGSPAVRDWVLFEARAEMARRRSGTDRFSSQLSETFQLDSRVDGAIVLALNSSWDSAALGLHSVYASSAEWIVETVRYLLSVTTAPIVVRQHPAERLDVAKSTDDYRELLSRNFPFNDRVLFIAAADPVNSYELMERAAVLVVYTSTIGVEAAASGKVVVTPSQSYYSSLGFVWKGSDLGEYQAHLQGALSNYELTLSMQHDALLCYYLTQCCNWVISSFTPEGFEQWSRSNFDSLAADDTVRRMVRCLIDGVPIAYLNHLKMSGGK